MCYQLGWTILRNVALSNWSVLSGSQVLATLVPPPPNPPDLMSELKVGYTLDLTRIARGELLVAKIRRNQLLLEMSRPGWEPSKNLYTSSQVCTFSGNYCIFDSSRCTYSEKFPPSPNSKETEIYFVRWAKSKSLRLYLIKGESLLQLLFWQSKPYWQKRNCLFICMKKNKYRF